jgi:hypothetical protein
VWAGWRTVARGVGGRTTAALAGLSIFAIDHLLLKGGMFLLMHAAGAHDQALLAFGGVVVSMVMLAPVPIALGMLGGRLARTRSLEGASAWVRRRDVPMGAVVLAWVLTAFGAVSGVVSTFWLTLYGVYPLLFVSRELDPGAHARLLALAATVGLSVVTSIGGRGLLRRRPWARPWIIVPSLTTLVLFLWTMQTTGEPLAQARAFASSPQVFSGITLVLTIGSAVVAALALLALAVRGRVWLPPCSRAQWVAACVVVATLHRAMSPPMSGDEQARRPPPTPTARAVATIQVEPGRARATIVPTFRGKVLDPDLDAHARVTFTDERTRLPRTLQARLTRGAIEVPDLDTGVYSLRLGVDLNRGNGMGHSGGMPGDMRALTGPRWELVKNGQTLRQEVALDYVMRLFRPLDTVRGVRFMSGQLPRFRSPVTFAWEGVPGATSYRALIRKSVAGAQEVGSTVQSDTEWTVDVPPTPAGEYYTLEVVASDETEEIGRLSVESVGGYAYGFHFAVVAPDHVELDQPGPDVPLPDPGEGAGDVVLVPTVDGEPLRPPDGTWSTVGLFPSPGVAFDGRVNVRTANGAVTVANVPAGLIAVGVLNVDTGPHGDAGDCFTTGDSRQRMVTVVAGQTIRSDVPVECVMRLVAPEDTAKGETKPPRELTPPLTFTWDAVPRAVRYTYDLRRDGQVVAHGDTREPRWTIDDLPRVTSAEYLFTVSAEGRSRRVGSLRVTGRSGNHTSYSPWYTFRVVADERPVESGKARLVLAPTFDGEPIANDDDLRAAVYLTELDSRDHRRLEGRLERGVIDVDEVGTGRYRVELALMATGPPFAAPPRANPVMIASDAFELAFRHRGETVRREVPMRVRMRLQSPESTEMPLRPLDQLPSVGSPVSFAWDAVPGARAYELELVDTGSGDPPRVERVTGTTWTVHLPAVSPRGFYTLRLSARGAQTRIGEFPPYQFRVRDGS